MMKKPLSMTPAAVRSRKYRGEIKGGRERTRGKKPPAKSILRRILESGATVSVTPKVRGTVFQGPWSVGQPTTMRQRIRDLAVEHMIRTSGKDLTYRDRQALLKSFDAELSALDETKPAPAKGHSPWNDQGGLAHAMKEIGPDNDTTHDAGIPTDAAPFRPAEAEDFERPWDAIRDGLTTGPELILAEAGELVPPGRSHSEVVAEMKAQRAAPKQAGLVEQPLYSAASQEAARMRGSMAECAKVIADAIVQGAKIIAGKEDASEIKYHETDQVWHPVGPGTPFGAWLETAEIISGSYGTITNGFNTRMCRILTMGDEPEWVEKEGGRTTVTHSTFAAPTHWRWPAK